ncbi:hypothetical protein, partial [Escherichia coli]
MKINIDKFIFSFFIYGVIFFPGMLMLLYDNLGSNYYGVIVIVSLVIVFKFIFNHNELFIAKKTFSSIFIIAGLIGFHLFIAVNLFELEKEENIFKILLSLLSLVAIFI